MNFQFEETVFSIPENENLTYLSGQSVNGAKLICLLSEDDNNVECIDLLQKITLAFGIDLNSQAKVFLISNDKHFTIQSFLEADKTSLISFGAHNDQIKTQFNKIPYAWLQFKDHNIIFVDKLMMIKSDVKLKKMLWEELKKVLKTG